MMEWNGVQDQGESMLWVVMPLIMKVTMPTMKIEGVGKGESSNKEKNNSQP